MAFESGSPLAIATVCALNAIIVGGCRYIGHRAAKNGVTLPPDYISKITPSVEQRIYRSGRNCGRKLRALKHKLLDVVWGNA